MSLRSIFCILLATLASSTLVHAQTRTVTYNLENVWLDPDITHPAISAEQMTGTFEWTYTVGDFENGSGQFLSLDLPWYGTDISGLTINVDLNTIEFTLPLNQHSNGVDLTLRIPGLLSTSLSTEIVSVGPFGKDFEIWAGAPYEGHVISGNIVPETPLDLNINGICPTVQIDVAGATPLSSVILLYSAQTGRFLVPSGNPCSGTMLGLDSNVTIATIVTADAAGSISLPVNVPASACGVIYIQAFDLATCGVSQVVLL